MDFTELYRQSNQLCRFSPSGNVIGTAVEHRLVLRDAESLQVTRLINTPSTIHHIEFSPNGHFILCANYSNRKDSSGLKSNGWIRVYEVTETTRSDAISATETPWEGKVDEGLSGLVLATFATNSHILGFSESNLRISIYSMVDNTVRCIRQPKHSSFNGFSARKDRKFMAYLERSDGRDNVVIIDMINWVIVKEFPVATTDAELISWSPCGRYILVFDTMFQYQLLVYSADGKMLGHCENCSEEKIALGFRLAKWSPSAQFIAAGSYDGSIELLNNYNWTSLTDISVPSSYDPSEDDFVCIKESGPAKLNSSTSGCNYFR
jgi:WD40 repeat protein